MVSTQIALALHTTTETLEIAICDIFKGNPFNSQDVKHNEWLLGRELSTQIHSRLSEFMAGYNWQDLEFIAIASGVGSYTGTRIGMVLARTLGEQLDIPIYAIACSDIERRLEVQIENSETQVSKCVNLLGIAHAQWVQGIYPHWSLALPLYNLT